MRRVPFPNTAQETRAGLEALMQSANATRSPHTVDTAPSTSGQSDAEHTHRWRVEEQHGAQSSGICACGAQREFENGWSGDRSLRLNAGWLTGRSNLRSATTEDAPATEASPDEPPPEA